MTADEPTQGDGAADLPQEQLWVPHLDRLELPASLEGTATDIYPHVLESICGATDDPQPVEQYNGTLGVATAFVSDNQSPVAQVQWNASLPYTNPGNVAGVRWGTGDDDLARPVPDGRPPLRPDRRRLGAPARQRDVERDLATGDRHQHASELQLSGRPVRQPAHRAELCHHRADRVSPRRHRLRRLSYRGQLRERVRLGAGVDRLRGAERHALHHGSPGGGPEAHRGGPADRLSKRARSLQRHRHDGGNSGSGILLASNASIIGVHTNGGCNLQGTGSNFGMRITSIRAQSPSLQGLATTVLWQSMGGSWPGDAAVGRNADGRLEVFLRGEDAQMYQAWQTAPNNGWSGWQSMGGSWHRDPVVASNQDGRLELFAVGDDGQLYQAWQTAPNNGWSGWQSMGGAWPGDAAVGRNADGRLEVFLRGEDAQMYQGWQTAPNNGWAMV